MHLQSIKMIRKKRITGIFIIMLCITMMMIACNRHSDLNINDLNENYRKAGDFIGNNYDLSLFNAALKHAGSLEELNGKGPFTVFAPTNEAFNAIGIQSAADFNKMNRDSLRFILGCHVLTQTLRVEDIPEKSINNLYSTISETKAEIASPSREASDAGNLLATDAAINGVRLKKSNIILFNGLLHTIKDLIKYNPKRNLQQQLESMPQYKILVAGLKKAKQWDQLSGQGPFTVVTVSDETFIKNGVSLESLKTMPDEISDWLFAPYIFKNKSLYVNDINIFQPKDINQGAPHESLPRYGNLSYMIFLSYIPSYKIFSTKFFRTINFGRMALCNYKTANGMIHELNELPLRLEDAENMKKLKNNF